MQLRMKFDTAQNNPRKEAVMIDKYPYLLLPTRESIFESISGEPCNSFPQGSPITFLRLQGCNLQCSYCDTVHTQKQDFGVMEHCSDVAKTLFATQSVRRGLLITGGEPLLQAQSVATICNELPASIPKVIETNGTIDIRECLKYITRSQNCPEFVVDYKMSQDGTPNFLKDNLTAMVKRDCLKFVVDSLYMIDSAQEFVLNTILAKKGGLNVGTLIFSPTQNISDFDYLYKVVADIGARMVGYMNKKVILTTQIHKVLNLK